MDYFIMKYTGHNDNVQMTVSSQQLAYILLKLMAYLVLKLWKTFILRQLHYDPVNVLTCIEYYATNDYQYPDYICWIVPEGAMQNVSWFYFLLSVAILNSFAHC